MPDEENVGVIDQEQASANAYDQQEVASPSQSDEQHNDSMQQQEIQAAKRKDADYNWSEMRRRQQELERQLHEERQLNDRFRQQQPQAQEEDPLAKLSNDDIVTKGQVEYIAEKKAEQRARKIVEEMLRQQDAESVEDRIVAKHPDFQAIVTADAIATLKQQHPEIAESLHALRDNPYKQAKAIYDAVKAFVPQKQVSAQQMLDKKRAAENAAKPMSVQAAPKQSVLGNAQMFENGLTPEIKRQLQKEMEEAIRRG